MDPQRIFLIVYTLLTSQIFKDLSEDPEAIFSFSDVNETTFTLSLCP